MTEDVLDPDYTVLAQVQAYWESLRGEQILPTRSQIDPSGLDPALDHAFILERIKPGVARLRVAGSHLNDLMGMEVRGMAITSFIQIQARQRFNIMMEELFETPAIGMLDLVNSAGPIDARMLLLPLKSDMGDTSRVLGCLITKGTPRHSPCRFDVRTAKITALRSGIASHPVNTSRHAIRPVQGFAEKPFVFDVGSKRSRPAYLRLVDPDKKNGRAAYRIRG